MTFVISEACVDVTDKSCMKVCPVDCIYEGQRKLYIHPDECVDCGACEPACPVQAISQFPNDKPETGVFLKDAVRFFNEPLPGRDRALGSPGGFLDVGATGVDTEFVAKMPQKP